MDLASLVPLPGSESGETFLAEGPEGAQVVRIYADPGARGALAQDVDAALLRMVRGLVPVPEIVDVRRPDAAGLPGLLVTGFVGGVRGDQLLPTLDDDARARLGRRVGDLVARLGGMPQPRAGSFVDGDLTLAAGDHRDRRDGLEGFVEARLELLTGWSDEERAGLLAVAADAHDLLDSVSRVCLVHGDLAAVNWLADPATLEITALLDWERAHAGHPAVDLGRALRLDRTPSYAAALLRGYCDRLGGDPGSTLDLARAADLWALVDLASRLGTGPDPVTENADRLLRAIARTRDVHTMS